MEKNKIEEEVTITPIIRDIERLFNKIVILLISLLSRTISLTKNFLLFCFKNLVPLVFATIIGGLIGFFSFYILPRSYSSNLVLEPNVNAKYQLYNDISFFEALIDREQHGRLAEILEISEEEAESLKEISVKPFNSDIERLKIIDQFYRNLDSTTKRKVNFEEIYYSETNELTNKYAVKIIGSDEAIFSRIEPSLIQFLERVPEFEKEIIARSEALKNQKSLLKKQLEDLDTLKNVTNQSILLRARKQNITTANSPNFGLSKQESNFNPLEIYDKYLGLADRLNEVEQKLINLNRTYTIHSHFSEFGSKYGFGKLKRALAVGLSFFTLALLLFGLRSASKNH